MCGFDLGFKWGRTKEEELRRKNPCLDKEFGWGRGKIESVEEESERETRVCERVRAVRVWSLSTLGNFALNKSSL